MTRVILVVVKNIAEPHLLFQFKIKLYSSNDSGWKAFYPHSRVAGTEFCWLWEFCCWAPKYMFRVCNRSCSFTANCPKRRRIYYICWTVLLSIAYLHQSSAKLLRYFHLRILKARTLVASSPTDNETFSEVRCCSRTESFCLLKMWQKVSKQFLIRISELTVGCLLATSVSHVGLNIRDCRDNNLLLLWRCLLLTDCMNDLNVLRNRLLNWLLLLNLWLWLRRHHRRGNRVRRILWATTWGARPVIGFGAPYCILQAHLTLLFGGKAALVTRARCIRAVLLMSAESDFHAMVSAANAIRLLPARRISILIGHCLLQSTGIEINSFAHFHLSPFVLFTFFYLIINN